jgi:hypothetical protein
MTNEEKLLRENIRKIITVITTKKNETKSQTLQEEKVLRNIIRKLLQE